MATDSRRVSRIQTAERPPRGILVAIHVLLIGFTLSPLLWVSVPPLVDYPNHLARMSILAHADQTSGVAQNYIPNWRLLPNLAMDLVVPALARFVSLDDAGRIFIAAAMALPVLGTMAMHRALHGRVGLWPLASLLFVYNTVLFFGFLNYLFSLGLAFIAFGSWVGSRSWPTTPRVVLFSAVASLLLVLHLFAFGVYGLLVGSYEAQRFLSDGKARSIGNFFGRAILVAQFIPAGLLWLASASNGGPAPISYGGLARKALAALAPTTFDLPPALFDAAILLFSVNFLFLAFRTGTLRLAPEMRLPIGAMVVLALAMPNWIGGSAEVDFRLPVALPFVLIASVRLTSAHSMPLRLAALGALVLLAARVWIVSESWSDMDRRFTEFRAVARMLPEGARLLVVQSPMPEGFVAFEGMPRGLAHRAESQFFHMPALAVVDRGVFIPYLFTGWFTIQVAPANAAISRMVGQPISPETLAALAAPETSASRGLERNAIGETPCCLDWAKKFDFVLWIDFGSPPQSLPTHLQPWDAGSFFRIYRVTPS